MSSNFKHYVGYGLALAAILLLGRFYYEEMVSRVKAEAQAQIVAERDKAQKEADSRFDARIAALKTPEQAAPVIRTIFKPQNAPISVPRSSLAPETQKTLPDAPEAKPDDPMMILDPSQQVDLGKRELGCQKTEGQLSTCELDKESLRKEINDLKGGSVFHMFLKETKCLGVLGGGAALGSVVGGWKGAAIGGVAGETACKIFF